MNLLYISPSVLPSKSANSVHVMRMCNAFSNLGIDVELLHKKGIKNYKSNQIFDYYGVDNNKFKLNSIILHNNRKINSISYAFKTLYHCLKTNYKNIYSRNQLCSILILLFSSKRIFIELHAPPTGIYRFFFKIFINTKRIRKVFLISEALKKIIISDFKLTKTNKIVVSHDGADEINNIKSNINFTKSSFDVGYVGHLYKGRGIEIILELAKKNKEIKFHIIGGLEEDINNWKRKIKSNNIIFYGHVKPKFVSQYLSKLDLLVAPYKEKVIIPNGLNTASYMSPLKIFEYMSAKKPILTSNLPVLREVLTHNLNSYLCDPNKFSDWNEGLRLLKSNSSLSKRISEKAFEDFKNLYTWSSRSKLISKHFE